MYANGLHSKAGQNDAQGPCAIAATRQTAPAAEAANRFLQAKANKPGRGNASRGAITRPGSFHMESVMQSSSGIPRRGRHWPNDRPSGTYTGMTEPARADQTAEQERRPAASHPRSSTVISGDFVSHLIYHQHNDDVLGHRWAFSSLMRAANAPAESHIARLFAGLHAISSAGKATWTALANLAVEEFYKLPESQQRRILAGWRPEAFRMDGSSCEECEGFREGRRCTGN